MSIDMRRPGPATNEDMLAAIESRLAAKLPPAYRKFLLQNNGGYSHVYSVPYIDQYLKSEQIADIFHWMSAGTTKHRDGSLGIEEGLKNMSDLLPKGVVPIAAEDGGDPIVMSLRREDYGSIYYFSGESPLDKAMNKLASSFEEFIGKLKLTRKRA